MLRIREKLRVISLAMSQPVTFNYASKHQQNTDANYQPLKDKPTINVVEIESGTFVLNANVESFKEQYRTTQIQFIKLSRHDYNSDQNDEIVDEMKELAKEFLLWYEGSELFEPLTEVPFYQIYHTYDDDTAGIEITLNVRELDSQSVCIPDVIVPPDPSRKHIFVKQFTKQFV